MTAKRIIIFVIQVLIGIFAGALVSGIYYQRVPTRGDHQVKRDTTITVDTTIFINPIPIDVEVNINDTIAVPPSDIILTADSLIILPKETRTYSDRSYRCQISGYQPQLDWIEVYPENRTITNTITAPDTRKNSIYIGADAGIYQGPEARIYAGYGRKTGAWEISLNAGYGTRSGTYVAATARLDIFRF